MTIDVTLLGTGSPLPSPDRAGPATLVRAGGQTFLFDTGRGVSLRLAAAGVVAPMLTSVLLTHLHSDHITDLNDMVTSRWVMSPAPNPLPIFGPVGTAEVVDAIMAMLAPDISYRIAHHDDMSRARRTWSPRSPAGWCTTRAACGSPPPPPTTVRWSPRSASGWSTATRSW